MRRVVGLERSARVSRVSRRELEEVAHAASARLHLAWRERVGVDRFDALWAALQELAELPATPPEDLEVLRQRYEAVADQG